MEDFEFEEYDEAYIADTYADYFEEKSEGPDLQTIFSDKERVSLGGAQALSKFEKMLIGSTTSKEVLFISDLRKKMQQILGLSLEEIETYIDYITKNVKRFWMKNPSYLCYGILVKNKMTKSKNLKKVINDVAKSFGLLNAELDIYRYYKLM